MTTSLVEASFVIQITARMRLLLAVEPVDFRKGIDGVLSENSNIHDFKRLPDNNTSAVRQVAFDV